MRLCAGGLGDEERDGVAALLRVRVLVGGGGSHPAAARRRPLALVRPVVERAALRHADHLDDKVLFGAAHGVAPAVRLRRGAAAARRAMPERCRGACREVDEVRHVTVVDVRVPLARGQLARGRAIAAVAKFEVAGHRVGNGEGGEGGVNGAQARGVPVGVVGRVDCGVAEAVVRNDALAGRRSCVKRWRELREEFSPLMASRIAIGSWWSKESRCFC